MVIGDPDANATYAAVGKALTRWEHVELSLAEVYSRFVGQPLAFGKIRQFGAIHRIFIDRLGAAKRAADAHFIISPDQAAEGSFLLLCSRMEKASNIRNNIAHGVVVQVRYLETPEGEGSTVFMLQAPWYIKDKPKGIDQAGMGAAEIKAATEPFNQLALDLRLYADRLRPPSP